MLTYSPEVKAALDAHQPVVALETTLIVHGLTAPDNLRVASEIEDVIRAEGAVPATIGLVAGVPTIGLTAEQLGALCASPNVPKLSVRDVPIAMALNSHGATTVASTMLLAARAGIRVFATGGLGGVHREASTTFDESADLMTLGREPVAVVCAGCKSILDIGATLERLETLNVPVLGYRTRRFPGFYLNDSGFPLDWQVDTPEQIAATMRHHWALHDTRGGLVIANPLPVEQQLDPALHDRVLAEGLAEATRRGLRGKPVSPFLLGHFHAATHGESLRVNIALVLNNARLAARVAKAYL
ncbi:MAG: pseudouridine-5'-phosphate glycosidase [Anaerolineales bacterium]|nr:pseudouridine-5'-phosphate glycosidase [Anaerolineales bacterium]